MLKRLDIVVSHVVSNWFESAVKNLDFVFSSTVYVYRVCDLWSSVENRRHSYNKVSRFSCHGYGPFIFYRTI